MIVFFIYILLFAGLFYFGTGRLFLRNFPLTKNQVVVLFLLKALAVPVFYTVYQKKYGGIENFDTGKYYHDVKVIAPTLRQDPSFFWRTSLGLQDDRPGSADYEKYLKHTLNWDNGTVKDYLYNDNRVVIRLHILLDVLSFKSYLAHALFNCLLSFVGILLLLQTFRKEFRNKEFLFLLVFCCFPALWFYTGALLKEGICVFLMGTLASSLRAVLQEKKAKHLLVFLPSLFLACLLKSYLLLSFTLFTTLYFLFENFKTIQVRISIFFAGGILIALALNFLSLHFRHRSLTAAALEHQKRFEAVSHGGVFLTDGIRYLQLPADTSNIERRPEQTHKIHIKSGVSYMYWEPNRSADTLYQTAMEDSTWYDLLYIIPPSGSNIQLNKSTFFWMAKDALYYSLFYPLFYNASNALQMLASLENLLIILSLFLILFLVKKQKDQYFFVLIFGCFVLFICLLVGLTAPNSGAIFRYRSEAVVFLPLLAIYLWPKNQSKNQMPKVEGIGQ